MNYIESVKGWVTVFFDLACFVVRERMSLFVYVFFFMMFDKFVVNASCHYGWWCHDIGIDERVFYYGLEFWIDLALSLKICSSVCEINEHSD